MLPEDNLIPDGWERVTGGLALGGDKYWDARLGLWLPVTVNKRTTVSDYVAVIRKRER